jgi:ubiquitin-protein ligase
VEFPNPNDLTNFNVTVSPDSGPWAGAKYKFTVAIPALYPHEPPKVLCRTKIYHPNINLEGNVCLNILREDWKPVLDINAVIYGMIYLFYEPNPDDPLNREAADLYRTDKAQVSILYNLIAAVALLFSVAHQMNCSRFFLLLSVRTSSQTYITRLFACRRVF